MYLTITRFLHLADAFIHSIFNIYIFIFKGHILLLHLCSKPMTALLASCNASQATGTTSLGTIVREFVVDLDCVWASGAGLEHSCRWVWQDNAH